MQWNCIIFISSKQLCWTFEVYSTGLVNHMHRLPVICENKRTNTLEKLFQDYLESCNFQICTKMEILKCAATTYAGIFKIPKWDNDVLNTRFNNSVAEYFFEQIHTSHCGSYMDKWRNICHFINASSKGFTTCKQIRASLDCLGSFLILIWFRLFSPQFFIWIFALWVRWNNLLYYWLHLV